MQNKYDDADENIVICKKKINEVLVEMKLLPTTNVTESDIVYEMINSPENKTEDEVSQIPDKEQKTLPIKQQKQKHTVTQIVGNKQESPPKEEPKRNLDNKSGFTIIINHNSIILEE